MTVHRGSVIGRAVLEGRIVHIHDVLADPEFTLLDAQKLGSFRTALGVPLVREGLPIGAMFLTRGTVDPFTQQQIDLVATFADQAVIAIENVRLFDEVQGAHARTHRVARIPDGDRRYPARHFELAGRRSAGVRDDCWNALRLCGARWSAVIRFDGHLMELAALHNLSEPEEIAAVRQAYPRPLSRGGSTARDPEPSHGLCAGRAGGRRIQHAELAQAAGFRSTLSVPMLREGLPLGAITVAGASPRAFSERQVDLLQTFADQAVIAIENVRMFDEVQARTRDLSEALEQQTATSQVLGVISSSPGELEPVFQTMLENATRICEARFGILFRYDDNACMRHAKLGVPPAYAEFSIADRSSLVRDRRSAASPYKADDPYCDTQAEATYAEREPSSGRAAELGRSRSLLNVPMLKEGELIGAIGIYRQEVRPVHPKADRVGHELRAPGRDRHREHAAAQRAAPIAAAADRHRRRAQGDQPLDVRSAVGARYARRNRQRGFARLTWRVIARQRGDAYYLPPPTISRRTS